MPWPSRRFVVISLVTLAVACVAIQLVPYGRVHSNPPVTGSPAWDAPATQAFFARACADCHSNETQWPWYGYVAPASWLVRSDVDEARSKFNVSEWGRPGRNEGDEAADNLESGEMPPREYLWLHPEARLDPEERRVLVAGLVATFGEERRRR